MVMSLSSSAAGRSVSKRAVHRVATSGWGAALAESAAAAVRGCTERPQQVESLHPNHQLPRLRRRRRAKVVDGGNQRGGCGSRMMSSAPPSVSWSLRGAFPSSCLMPSSSSSMVNLPMPHATVAFDARRYESSFFREVVRQMEKEMASNPKLEEAVKRFRQQQDREPRSLATSSSSFVRLWRVGQKIATRISSVAGRSAEAIAWTLFSGANLLSRKTTTTTGNSSSASSSPSSFTSSASSSSSSFTSVEGSALSEAVQSLVGLGGRRADALAAERDLQIWRRSTGRLTLNNDANADVIPESSHHDDNDVASSSVRESENGVVNDQLVLLKLTRWQRLWNSFTMRRRHPYPTSSWMSFTELPVVQLLLGETEEAGAIRAMRSSVDPSFSVEKLARMVQHIIAPHLLNAYLRNDKSYLKIHCSEGAYAALTESNAEKLRSSPQSPSSSSPSSAETPSLRADPLILLVRNVEFRSATKGEASAAEDDDANLNSSNSSSRGRDGNEHRGPDINEDEDGSTESLPSFVFSFSAQQVERWRDENDGRIVVGSLDDVTEVTYVMTLIPQLNKTMRGLEYPWQIKELTIAQSVPCW